MTEDEPSDGALRRLSTEPKTVALIGVIFLLLVGLPAALYGWAGRWDVAIGLIVLFGGMVGLTAYALKVAAEVERARK